MGSGSAPGARPDPAYKVGQALVMGFSDLVRCVNVRRQASEVPESEEGSLRRRFEIDASPMGGPWIPHASHETRATPFLEEGAPAGRTPGAQEGDSGAAGPNH